MWVLGMSRKLIVYVVVSFIEKIFKIIVEIDCFIDNFWSIEYYNVSVYVFLKNNVFIWKE